MVRDLSLTMIISPNSVISVQSQTIARFLFILRALLVQHSRKRNLEIAGNKWGVIPLWNMLV